MSRDASYIEAEAEAGRARGFSACPESAYNRSSIIFRLMDGATASGCSFIVDY